MTPFFLVHHALAGGDSSYVERFFGDVQNAVYERLGYREVFTGEAAGAAESSPATGGRSNPDALLAPVMVALYSDAYFTDHQCLLEWSLFRERLRWHHHFTGRSSPALVGVPWSIRSVPVPAQIAEAGMLVGDFGAGYTASGALQLIRTGSASVWYQQLTERVSELIVRARGDEPPALSTRDVEFVERSGRTDWVSAGRGRGTRWSAGSSATLLIPPAPLVPLASTVRTAPTPAAPTPAAMASAAMAPARAGGRERRWRMADPEHTRRPILRRAGAAELDDDDD
ncbi:hypothetical protein E0F15_02460 [Frankia sp. B2]|uniref:hypothetical protein n=1 Tax=unclassified Frankia TaxID=2632575 RepID=UPI000461C031|nr:MULTISPECIES: hypothetical protein [unclassified Frankia]KDA42784.1 hypothetical protein BMG523Draft_02334 [Frankia sp. BMG5.23]KEZ36070.1 hypothetical protein CEDDRAFT_02542 [Frankia sp. CeD]OFB38540.1 hypothetical protein Manayef4_04870 [Frankia sp. CgIM4]ORT56981.1 hypothetical protein KBI5_00120 [Frankia sp. KB5]TFE34919.1 hypothetical protein E0F15_02460 [Frankia sp. B2]